MLVYTLHLTGYIYYQLMIQDKYTVALYHLHLLYVFSFKSVMKLKGNLVDRHNATWKLGLKIKSLKNSSVKNYFLQVQNDEPRFL